MMAGGRERKLEYFVVAVVLSVAVTVFLERVGSLQREIEEAAVQSEVSALRVEILDRLSHREVFGGPLPASENPVDWAGRQPQPYAGSLDGPPQETGVWYFDTSARVLVYRSRHDADFRFRLVRGAGREQASAVLAGVGLIRIEPGK